ncbi:ABC transporter ATP-binding protein [Candidatus Kaiserbacteria bacterium]|nr:ABC transporter ATP-binding protein [Candidatus Kaiserbacteria bacterium]
MNLTTWKWLFNHLKLHTWSITVLLLVSVVFGLIEIAVPLVLQRLVDAAAAGTQDVGLMVGLVALTIGSAIPLPYWLRERLHARFGYKLHGDLFQSLLCKDMSFHDDRGSTILAMQAVNGVKAAGGLLNILTGNHVFLHIPVAIFAIFYLGQYSVYAVVLLIGFLICFVVCSKFLGRKISTEEEAYQEINNELTHRRREAVHQIQTVKVNNAVAHELGYYWREGKGALQHRLRIINLHNAFNLMSSSAQGFALIVVVAFFIPQVVSGDITVGVFLALVVFASRIVGPVEFLGDVYAEIKEASALLKPVMEILENKPQVIEQSSPLQLNPVRGSISLRGVSFRYPGRENFILKDISLTIPAGKKTAIVGRSGSGKSTLARLLTRLYDPSAGVIEYDGTDLRNVGFKSLYREVAYLTQEVAIFTSTIAQNVAYGLDDFKSEDVAHALFRSSAHFVEHLENGQDTMVGELGKKLSGGERQRLVIARLFIRNPSVVILDEATSALDNVTESEVHQAFEELGKQNGGKTMIVIAHRLSTVMSADQIVVMDNGEVLDVGTHGELIGRCQLYYDLNKTLVTA